MIEIGNVRLFTIEEIARKLGITSHTVRRYIVKDKALPGQKLGKRLYVSEQGLSDFMRSPFKPRAKRSKK